MGEFLEFLRSVAKHEGVERKPDFLEKALRAFSDPSAEVRAATIERSSVYRVTVCCAGSQ